MSQPRTGSYVSIVSALLMRPVTFFEEPFKRISTGQACWVLLISAIVYTAITVVVSPCDAWLRLGAIAFTNAVGMVIAAALIGYLALVAMTGRRYAFPRLLNVFSLSASAVLLFAWIPTAFIFTEPWRWWLIGTGLARGLGVSKVRSAMVVVVTFGGVATLVYTFLQMAGT